MHVDVHTDPLVCPDGVGAQNCLPSTAAAGSGCCVVTISPRRFFETTSATPRHFYSVLGTAVQGRASAESRESLFKMHVADNVEPGANLVVRTQSVMKFLHVLGVRTERVEGAPHQGLRSLEPGEVAPQSAVKRWERSGSNESTGSRLEEVPPHLTTGGADGPARRMLPEPGLPCTRAGWAGHDHRPQLDGTPLPLPGVSPHVRRHDGHAVLSPAGGGGTRAGGAELVELGLPHARGRPDLRRRRTDRGRSAAAGGATLPGSARAPRPAGSGGPAARPGR
jgi:hypothetical protein